MIIASTLAGQWNHVEFPFQSLHHPAGLGITQRPVHQRAQRAPKTVLGKARRWATIVVAAHHLAMASFHRCDRLVTWNCKHLANPNKIEHIRMVNSALGIHTPQLLTPLEILGATL